jgi:hypothetical protein
MYLSDPFQYNPCSTLILSNCLTTNKPISGECPLDQYFCCFFKEGKEAKRKKPDYKTQIADKKENTILPNPSSTIKITLLPPKAVVMQV